MDRKPVDGSGSTRGVAAARGGALAAARALAGASALVLATLSASAQDAAKDIKAKEPEKRVAAVEALRSQGGEAAEKLLVGALLDKDWEVVERAALALRDVGSKGAVPQLIKVSIDGPAARIRRAAALAIAKIDPAKGVEDLAKQSAGKNATRAWQALAIVGPAAAGAQSDSLAKNLRKSQKAKEAAEKAAAAGAIACAGKEDMLAALEAYLAGEDVAHAAAALRSVASSADADVLAKVQAALARKQLGDVLERRLIATAASVAALLPAEHGAKLLDAVCGGAEAAVAARGMRLAHALSTGPAKDAALTKLEAGLSHASADVRAAAVHAGVRAKHEPVLVKSKDLANRDPDARVRAVALTRLVEQLGIADPDVFAIAVERLQGDSDASVREQAAVSLGGSSSEDAVKALASALGDKDWAVAACAAVSLGKTTHETALAPLLALSKDPDWRRRGAAIVGLCHVTKNDAVPAVLAAIADAEPAIANTARVYAKAVARQDLGADSKAWIDWWAENGKRVKMWTPEEAKARREKYGYARTAEDVFKDLDVIVLDSRGDHIQKVLEHEKLAFRTTAAAKHRADGLHPHGVYVSNCTGEVEAEDLERIAWFVRTGGYLFGSCWSLHETIEKVYPGVVRKYEGMGEVLDTVDAEPIALDSPYLKGVFDGGVEPQYNLEGAHLIEVIDRERCEVLVDSPDCATRWGNGNLAVWFRAGHGLILDSVNHFDNQGLVNASFLKEDEERQAYALDRMGMSYERWRATKDQKWWSSNTKAAEQVFDLTALHLVVNFVRSKRLEEM